MDFTKLEIEHRKQANSYFHHAGLGQRENAQLDYGRAQGIEIAASLLGVTLAVEPIHEAAKKLAEQRRAASL